MEENHTVEELEELSFDEDDYDQQPPPDIIAYNELRSCADLVRMYDNEILDIKPDFQRDVVWRDAGQTRFVDSLIKQLPIPSMCFSLDYKSQKWQVIDGLQRMSSIIRFLKDKNWRLSYLTDIDPKISGRKVSEFHDPKSELNILLRRVENMTLPITVIRCDYSKKSHSDYMFTIFHRLNTGAIKLNNQEIRNCIFNGTFNTLIKDLNDNENWQRIIKSKDSEKKRFTFVELILRFYAFIDFRTNYKGRLAKFLNDYMAKKRNITQEELEQKRLLFQRVAAVIDSKVFEPKESRLLFSVLEALLYGVAKNIDKLERLPVEDLRERFKLLKLDKSLSSEYLKGSISDTDKVDARLDAAERIFGQ
jgi:hypothetical protein